MRTAEVAIEHVLAGILAFCSFLLPLLSTSPLDLTKLGTESVIGILGLSYLLGVVFDRIADTVLGPLENYLRLKTLSDAVVKRERAPSASPDLFPQDELEIYLRGKNDGRLEWMDSLASRIRTSRALAVLGFPAALGVAIYLSRGLPDRRLEFQPEQVLALANLGLLVVALLLSKVAADKKIQPGTREVSEELRGAEQSVPADLRGNERKEKAKKAVKEKAERIRRDQRQIALDLTLPYVGIFLSSAIATTCLYVRLGNAGWALVGAAGAIASLLALWAWWRIKTTYLRFVSGAFDVWKKDPTGDAPQS